MITTFNLFDFIGRNSAGFYIPRKNILWAVTLGRFLFWGTFILVAESVSPSWLFEGTWFKFLNMAIYAFSNGYSSTCLMILGPSQVEGKMKDIAGYTMATGLVTGIFSGTCIAFAFSSIGYIPKD